jgi:hypothetical protein
MTKISNQYSLTNILTADLTNSRLGVNNTNPSYSLDLTGDARVGGSLIVTGNLTAQQFIVSSSVTYLTESFASGSTKFGDTSDDNHNFTGSLIVSGSANPLRVGSNLLFVSSSGNVGIGTTSPLLTATDRGNLTVNGTTSNIITLGIAGGYSGYLYSDSTKVELSSATQPMTFVTNGVERIRIISGGAVGIGTSNPTGITSDAKLVVTNGSFVIDTENNGYGGLKIDTDSTGDYNVNIRQGRGGASGGIRFFTNGRPGGGGAFTGTGTERLTILGSGNVGINNADPQRLLHITNTSGGSTTDTLMLQNGGNTSVSGTGARLIFKIGGFSGVQINTLASIEGVTDGESSVAVVFKTASYGILFPAAERMRLTGGGDFLVGTTTSGVLASANGITLNAGGMIYANSNNTHIFNRSTNSSGTVVQFRYNEATVVGTIAITSSTTSYNTSSDYRLKEDLKSINGLEKVSALNVYDFKWKSSDDRMDGFLAHELQEVLPYAVSGIKDGEDMQQVDYSKIVPVLVKAIQELSAENTSLINRIEALENK